MSRQIIWTKPLNSHGLVFYNMEGQKALSFHYKDQRKSHGFGMS